MIKWFVTEKGSIAILDATNSTKVRRQWIHDWCTREGIEVLFVESKCDDEDLIMSNIREVKTTSPDYKGQDPEVAAADFRNRIRNYEKVYETIDDNSESHLTYVKLVNVNSNVIINGIKDYLQSRIVYYLLNLHIKPRSIWISRHGESEYNLSGLLGGDANLSSGGLAYSKKLPQMVRESGAPLKMNLWTSTLQRTIQTARHLVEETEYTKLEWKALDELDAGVCDGLTYAQVEDKYPEDFKARDADKYNYRYRGGESYRDVVIRLEPIIMELERSENIMIVTHQAVLRCIYAYFMKVPMERSPWMEVPLHTLIRLTPKAYGTHEERWTANIPAVSTFRARGTSNRVSDASKDHPAVKKTMDELKLTPVNENAIAEEPLADGELPKGDSTPKGTVVVHKEGEQAEKVLETESLPKSEAHKEVEPSEIAQNESVSSAVHDLVAKAVSKIQSEDA